MKNSGNDTQKLPVFSFEPSCFWRCDIGCLKFTNLVILNGGTFELRKKLNHLLKSAKVHRIFEYLGCKRWRPCIRQYQTVWSSFSQTLAPHDCQSTFCHQACLDRGSICNQRCIWILKKIRKTLASNQNTKNLLQITYWAALVFELGLLLQNVIVKTPD